ncbi:ATP-binding protein [Alkalilimnicola ehrlichii]|uniref:ATP-binding protein n=1 Tax=Alkalilimnicola ehrlichii TaxID=351052 RepID=UPI003BA2373E
MLTQMQDTLRFKPRQVLRILMWLRLCAVVGQAITVLGVYYLMGLDLPLAALLTCVGLLAAFNAAVYVRLQLIKEASHREVFIHLMVDSLVLTALLFLSGGPSNPFVSLYLVPIALAAVALPSSYAWWVGAASVVLYGFLLVWFLPMEAPYEVVAGDINLHLFGTWVNFILSVVLITFFVSLMAATLRRQDMKLAEAREGTLRNEQIVAIGTLAAGAAHQLGTPLSSMSMVVEELRDSREDDEALQEDLDILESQIQVCKQTLAELMEAAGNGQARSGGQASLRQFIGRIINTWSIMRPDVRHRLHFQEPFENPCIFTEQTLMHAIINLLNNAADASVANGSDRVQIDVACRDGELTLSVIDEGQGLDADAMEQAGRVIHTTKPEGLGIGLVLSNATVGRFGGSVTLLPADTGGVLSRITLPLNDLRVSDKLADEPGGCRQPQAADHPLTWILHQT